MVFTGFCFKVKFSQPGSAGAVHAAQEASAPDGEERSIGSLPQGFFDMPTNSGGQQVRLPRRISSIPCVAEAEA